MLPISLPFRLLLLLGWIFFAPLSHVQAYAHAHASSAQLILLHQKHSLALLHGRIVAIGDVKKILRNWQGKNTRLLKVPESYTIMPGFIESHGHLQGVGKSEVTLNLRGIKDPQQIAELVAQKAQTVPAGQWIIGRGWDQNLWANTQFPTHEILTRAAPQHPVYLTRVDGHAAWVNQLALQLAHVDQQTPDPSGGRILRDAISGEPTGVLIDGALDLVFPLIPSPTLEQVKEMLWHGALRANQLGITSWHDAGISETEWQAYRQLLQEGKLPLRINAMLDGSDAALLQKYVPQGPQTWGDGKLRLGTIKLFADGALGSRGAALLEDYSDAPGERGLMQLEQRKIFHLTAFALKHHYQVATHGIGDAAVRSILLAYQQALDSVFPENENKEKGQQRLRIEHAQIIHPQDRPLFKKLGIIASMQFSHGPSDMAWARLRLGMDRTEERAYVWRSLLQEGVVLAAGSDAPVEDLNPMVGLFAATTGLLPEQWEQPNTPDEGWNPQQTISVQQAIDSYTRAGAFAEFQEKHKGIIAPGAYGDLVILSRPLVVPQDFLQAKVLMTIVGGEVVYQDSHWRP